MIKPEIIKRKIKAFSESFKIVTTTYLFRKDNDQFEFDFYSIKNPDFVVGLAFKDDKILLVEQYRFPIDNMNVEFVCGRIDHGSSPEEAIHNEMIEEAGIRVKSLQYLGCLRPTAGRASNKGYVYLITDFDEVEPQHETFEEFTGLSHYWLPLEAFKFDIINSVINDGITLMAWGLYLTVKGEL